MKRIVIIIFILGMYGMLFAQGEKAEDVSGTAEAGEYTVYDVYKHEDIASNILLGWGGASVGTGFAMISGGNDYFKGMGFQNVVWGAVDTGIAILMKNTLTDRMKEKSPEDEAKWFRDILKINFLIDIVYIASGTALTIWGDDNIKGHGTGIALQGVFLMTFDGINLSMSEEFEKKYPDQEKK